MTDKIIHAYDREITEELFDLANIAITEISADLPDKI